MFKMNFFGERPDGLAVCTLINDNIERVIASILNWGNRQDRLAEFNIAAWGLAFPSYEPVSSIQLVCKVTDEWTIHCENGLGLTTGLPFVISKMLGVKVARITSTVSSSAQHPSCFIEYVLGDIERTIGVISDPKFRFISDGPSQDFEDTSSYRTRTIRNRFTDVNVNLFTQRIPLQYPVTCQLNGCKVLVDRLLSNYSP